MNKKFYTLILGLVLIFVCFKIYNLINYTHIIVKFKELRPYPKQIPVYYKGIKIGKAKENTHSQDLQHTLVKISIKHKKLNFPDNIEVYLNKQENNNISFDYLEIIYPKEPSKRKLKNRDIIKGTALVDFDDYMSNHHPDDLETIRRNLTESSENLNNMLEGLSTIFVLLNDILEENRNNLHETTKNLSNTTKNLNIITSKINNSIEDKSLNNTFKNIEHSSNNFNDISINLINTTNKINKLMPEIDSTLCQIYSIAENTNCITKGIQNTLKKQFGGTRLFFGKVIEE